MKTTLHRMAKAGTAVTARKTQHKLEVVLHALRPEVTQLFSDREEDAAEYASLLRDFERVHDEALGSGRYS